ncbi:cobalamin biosynthesis protein [Paraburkholderia kururiensis]|uniref:cobalamin biosynthesis protein n=1 Tax=Paraburkholderia kururiensis TaxID=984307 RepID=UPI001F31DD35|nr:cobalamin biosynthesis protein [Paraburkholderia kururiensis]
MSRTAMPDSLTAANAQTAQPVHDADATHATHAADRAATHRSGRSLVLGIGCRRGVSLAQIEAAVQAALRDVADDDGAAHRASTHIGEHVACLATLDAKAHEPALLAFCHRHALPLKVFSAEEIAACLREHPDLARSAAAIDHVGVAAVCEPCALLAARGGRLVAAKRACDGVTVAIADAHASRHSPNQPPMRTP